MSGTLTWLITGTSRGIGLEIVTQLLTSPKNVVIAACRNPDKATALHELKSNAQGTLHVIPLDVSSTTSIEAALQPVQEIVGDHGLDYLINNAAINITDDRGFDLKVSDFLDTLTTNVIGPAHLAQTLLPVIEKSQKKFILNFSSGLASMGLDCGPKCTTYSISKTAISMLTYKQSKARPDFTVIAIDPGWVKTEMGGPGAQLEPPVSVAGILSVVTSTPVEASGKFFRYTGEEIPW